MATENKDNAELLLPFIATGIFVQNKTLVFYSTPNFLIPTKRKRPEFYSWGILCIIVGEFQAFPMQSKCLLVGSMPVMLDSGHHWLREKKTVPKNSVYWDAHCESVNGKSLRVNHLPCRGCRILPPAVQAAINENLIR